MQKTSKKHKKKRQKTCAQQKANGSQQNRCVCVCMCVCAGAYMRVLVKALTTATKTTNALANEMRKDTVKQIDKHAPSHTKDIKINTHTHTQPLDHPHRQLKRIGNRISHKM